MKKKGLDLKILIQVRVVGSNFYNSGLFYFVSLEFSNYIEFKFDNTCTKSSVHN